MLNTTFRPDQVAADVFIAPTAVVLGDVTIGPGASIWFGAVVRGDTEAVRIARDTNVQDGCILHADPGFPCSLGQRVTLGHGAIVHGAIIEDDCLIGMRVTILNGAKIGRGSLIAAGALVPEGMEIPPGSVVMGQPARVKREATERDRARIQHAAEHYVIAAAAYRAAR